MARAKPRLGVSACLLGHAVRYDGADKRDPFVRDVLGKLVEWVPVCPEVEVGMGVPREPVRLVGSRSAPRLLGVRSGEDHTGAMLTFAKARVRELEALDLAGWVTKARSPSCGLAVPVHAARGAQPRHDAMGLFVRVLRARMPLLPVEEEERLEDPEVRRRFVERVFAYERRKGARLPRSARATSRARRDRSSARR